MKRDRIDTFAATSLIAFSALLGLNQVMIKVVNAGLQPVFQAGLRSLIALPFVVAWCLWRGKKMGFGEGTFWPGILCGMLFGGEFILLFLALDYTTVSRTAIFFYTMPFWLAIAAHFLIPGERLTTVRVCGLVLAFAGVVLALSEDSATLGPDALLGDFLCLIAAMMWGGIALVARTTALSKSTPEMQLIYQLLVSAPMILFASLFFGDFVRELEWYHLAILGTQSVVVVAFGFAFWFWILSVYPASDMASFGFLAPVFGVFFAWAILGDEVGPVLIVSLVMVGAGIVLVNRKPKQAVVENAAE
ncbi:DMT family transporter [Pseudahrensia aquimaris]|uniref:DMT family transporter n=1 Tax=Pseudahrensia aquimaris TaxID=744461 RepID=A0ABW3FFX7_9HYPH